jgi:hypothetical protein
MNRGGGEKKSLQIFYGKYILEFGDLEDQDNTASILSWSFVSDPKLAWT